MVSTRIRWSSVPLGEVIAAAGKCEVCESGKVSISNLQFRFLSETAAERKPVSLRD